MASKNLKLKLNQRVIQDTLLNFQLNHNINH